MMSFSNGAPSVLGASMQKTTGIRRSQIEPSDGNAQKNESVGAPFRRVQLLHTNERLEKLDLTSSSSTPGAKMVRALLRVQTKGEVFSLSILSG